MGHLLYLDLTRNKRMVPVVISKLIGLPGGPILSLEAVDGYLF